MKFIYFFFRKGRNFGWFPQKQFKRKYTLWHFNSLYKTGEREKSKLKKKICSLLWQHSFLSYFLLVLRNIHHPFSHVECCTAKQCFIVFCFCCCLFISDMPVCLFICFFLRHFLHFYSQLLFRFRSVLFGRTNEWNFFRWRRNI